MQITLIRPPLQDIDYTISDLYVNDTFFSNTLEDRDRGLYQEDTLDYIKSIKVKHETAIPYGTYQVVMSFSNKFQKYLPELLDVPGFVGIRMHSGNKKEDTDGCILSGIKQGNQVINSRVTHTKLQQLITSAVKKEKVFITIKPTQ